MVKERRVNRSRQRERPRKLRAIASHSSEYSSRSFFWRSRFSTVPSTTRLPRTASTWIRTIWTSI
ncbi:hypothetical protein D3C86_2018140 [compost metagenome]